MMLGSKNIFHEQTGMCEGRVFWIHIAPQPLVWFDLI